MYVLLITNWHCGIFIFGWSDT